MNMKIISLCGMTQCSFVETCFPYVQVQSLSRCCIGTCSYKNKVREVRVRKSQKLNNRSLQRSK